MRALIQNELRQSRKQLLIWLGVMLLVIGFCYYEFLSLKDSLSDVAQMLAGFPALPNIMFGVKGRLDTALGWYSCIYFWTAILAFTYALSLGLSCVAKEIRRGTSAYLFTKPVSRKQIVMAKVIASIADLLVFSVFCGGCSYVMIVLPAGGLERPGAAVTTTVGLFLTQVMFFAAGLLIASLVKKYKSAVQVGTVFLLASYVAAITAQYAGLPLLDYFSPLRYFDVYEVTVNGIRFPCLVTAIILIALCIAAAARKWQLREVTPS